MVIRDFKYTPEDVDCRYCTEYRKRRCKAQKCICASERVEAGVLSYQVAVREAFEESSPLWRRIKVVLAFYDKSFWKDEAHFKRFNRLQATFGYYRKRNTNAYYAALFLLSSDEKLTVKILDCITKKEIKFSKVKLSDISIEGYALYKVAKSLYTESAEVSVDELADPELVDAESFRLVINAMLIYRYGLSALYLKSEGDGNGSMPS